MVGKVIALSLRQRMQATRVVQVFKNHRNFFGKENWFIKSPNYLSLQKLHKHPHLNKVPTHANELTLITIPTLSEHRG